LAGGFDGAQKGYNPEDQGEWIMVRMSPAVRALMTSAAPSADDHPPPASACAATPGMVVAFNRDALYHRRRHELLAAAAESSSSSGRVRWERFERRYFAHACLLLNADGGKDRDDKLLCCGIGDGACVRAPCVVLFC
jgi:hypothetical protein